MAQIVSSLLVMLVFLVTQSEVEILAHIARCGFCVAVRVAQCVNNAGPCWFSTINKNHAGPYGGLEPQCG